MDLLARSRFSQRYEPRQCRLLRLLLVFVALYELPVRRLQPGLQFERCHQDLRRPLPRALRASCLRINTRGRSPRRLILLRPGPSEAGQAQIVYLPLSRQMMGRSFFIPKVCFTRHTMGTAVIGVRIFPQPITSSRNPGYRVKRYKNQTAIRVFLLECLETGFVFGLGL